MSDVRLSIKSIKNSFNITKEEIDQDDINITNIENKIKGKAEKESSEFSELISRIDQVSLKEQNEKSIVQDFKLIC